MTGMKSNKIAAVVTLSVLVTVMAATQADAGVIGQTKYTCDDGTCVFVNGRREDQYFDELVIDWSTAEMSGNITSAQLTDLTFTLSNAGEVVYQDQAIINSLPQPIDGQSRALSDIQMSIDLDTPFMSRYSNANPGFPPQLGNDFGHAYNFFWSARVTGMPHVADYYQSGGHFEQVQWRPSSVTTVVPEPTTAFLFGSGMLLASGSLRRRRD